jgi:hypothetical protein
MDSVPLDAPQKIQLRALLLKPDTPIQEFGKALGIQIVSDADHETIISDSHQELLRDCIRASLTMTLTDDWLTFSLNGQVI